jgi:signal transduction histidine kinase/CheY-like chemotaxis protein/HPt (histidine-containing phosphotransfer) domain-containing protein
MKFRTVIRANLRELFFVFLAFVLMVLVSLFFAIGIVDQQIRSNTEKVFDIAETTIRSLIREAEVALLNTTLSVQNKLEEGQSPADIQHYITDLTNWLSMPENSVSGLQNIRGYVQGIYIDGQGWEPPENYDGLLRPWHLDAYEAGENIARSEAFPDPRTGKTLISLAKTLKSSWGEDYGVISVVVDISIIMEYVKNLQVAEGGYGMLVNRNLVIIAHPEAGEINRPLADISRNHEEIARNLLTGKTAVSMVRLRGSWELPVMLSFQPLYTGWYLGIAMPVSSYYRTAKRMALALSILGLVFMSILSFFLIRLSMQKLLSDEENKSKSSFLARMSHEIRTPMNSILGMAELVQRKAISPEIDEYISIISQSGQTLLAIINDILDFSKITSGKFQIEPRKYRLSSIINDAINVIRMKILEKPLDFLVTVDSNIPAQLVGDDVRVRQILINLLNNAIKYTPRGFVSLDIRRGHAEPGKLKLICTVSDSGIGVKTEDRARLFSDFTRLDSGINLGIEGTGLGLAITQALCQAMGGSISVTSEYGKGSSFTAIVVQSFEDDKKLAQVHHPESKHILFFENRPLIFEAVKKSFHNLGLNPVCFQDTGGFLAELEKGIYDYAFVSSRYAPECIHVLSKGVPKTQLVIMVEMGDVAVSREVKSIMMPVYSLPIANVVNNIHDAGTVKNLRPRFEFTAPTAKILIVDDISSNLRVARELMAPYNMEVHTCLSGAEAVKLVRENRYDIVFMDHMMPGMDGLEASAAIRAMGSGDDYFRKLPIIALTANAVSGRREMFLDRGLNDFIAKPVEIKHLDSVLERWLPREKKIAVEAAEEISEPEKPVSLKIPGLNTDMGLLNVNNSMEVYLDILSEFCRNARELTNQILLARESENTTAYAQTMHALKGASWSVGAMELGNLAKDLEEAAKHEEIAVLHEGIAGLLAEIDTVIGNISSAVSARQAGTEAEGVADLHLLHLDKLRTALTGMDIEAVNRMLRNFLSISMDSKTKEMIVKIEEHILLFEYDKAVAEINSLIGPPSE